MSNSEEAKLMSLFMFHITRIIDSVELYRMAYLVIQELKDIN